MPPAESALGMPISRPESLAVEHHPDMLSMPGDDQLAWLCLYLVDGFGVWHFLLCNQPRSTLHCCLGTQAQLTLTLG